MIEKLCRTVFGPHGYNQIQFLKALILQVWQNLSDQGLEEVLRVLLDFMIITQLTAVADHITVCWFRNLLTRLEDYGMMF